MQTLINAFSNQVQIVTGRAPRANEIKRFVEEYETMIAHKRGFIVEMGFCDFQTLSGRAEVIRINVSEV